MTAAVQMPAAAVAAPGYRDFVAPGHPVVRELLGAPPEGAENAADALAAVLAAARRRLRYEPTPGRHDFAEVGARVAAAGGGPVVLNCIDGVCAVASQLRAAGLGADEVWVALGGVASPIGADLGTEFHAWLAVPRGGGRWLWIDPVRWLPEETDGAALLAEHRLYVLFNDRRVLFLDDDKRRLLTGAPAARTHLYLFGAPDPAFTAALGDAAFGRLVAVLARDGRAPGGAFDDGGRERWLTAGLLAEEGGWLVPGPQLLVVPRAAEEEAFAAAAPHVDRYLELVEQAVPVLRRAFEATTTARRWSWDEVAATVVAAMLLDLAVGREFGILGAVHRAKGDSVLWAFEGLSSDQGVGVVWIESPAGEWGAGQLWHPAVRRSPMRLAPAMVDVLGRAALGEPPAPGAEVLYLRHRGLLRTAAGALEVAWPAFLPADAAALSAPLAEAAGRIFGQAVRPALDAVAERPWWRDGRQDESHRHAVLRLLLNYACQRVFGTVLPVPRAEMPESWGRWLWLGSAGDALPRRRDAAADGREEATA